jgi:WD40 repeat protein
LRQVLTGHTGAVRSVAFAPDSTMLASAAMDGTVRLWGLTDGRRSEIRLDAQVQALTVAYPLDGQSVAAVCSDKALRFWHSPAGTPLTTLSQASLSRPKRLGNVHCLAFAVDHLMATGGKDRTLRLWKIVDGWPVRTRDGASHVILRGEHAINSVAFSPDGQWLATGDDGRKVGLWQVRTGTVRFVLEGHRGKVFDVAFAPDSAVLASASADGTVRLWQVADGTVLAELHGARASVRAVAFAPNGQLLASGGVDQAVRLWRAADGARLGVRREPRGTVWSLAFSPDGRLLAAGCGDTAIYVWECE